MSVHGSLCQGDDAKDSSKRIVTVIPLSETRVIVTPLLTRICRAWVDGKRRLWLEGGTYASKTWSTLQFLRFLAEKNSTPLHITVTSETMPHLKRGCILDFQKIMGDDFKNANWNRTDFIYRWDTCSWIEFVSADVPSKFTGGRRDILFANEVNHIPKDTFDQGDMRTELFTIADWNPEGEFWFHHNRLADVPGNVLINTNYLEALDVLSPEKRAEIESWKELDPNRWRIYGLGLQGKIEGLVYPHFEQVDTLPQGAVFYGLDFGFASDPTVLVKNVILGDKLYSQQMVFDNSGLTNDQIGRKMTLLGVRREPIYPDPDEPKSAEELRRLGFNVIEAVKGKGSVAFGIQRVNQYYQHWTKDSLECIKEQRNFRYLKDRTTGEYRDETTHQWSHGMDARRYAVAPYQGAIQEAPKSRQSDFKF